jgi:hypothetical protein
MRQKYHQDTAGKITDLQFEIFYSEEMFRRINTLFTLLFISNNKNFLESFFLFGPLFSRTLCSLRVNQSWLLLGLIKFTIFY